MRAYGAEAPPGSVRRNAITVSDVKTPAKPDGSKLGVARTAGRTIESDPSRLAARLKWLRTERGWTLAELSRLTKLSKPYLSRLESGQRQPSLAALLALARTYEAPLQSLLDSGAPPGPSPVVIHGNRAQIQRSNGLRYQAISGGGGLINLSAVHVTVPRGRRQTALAQHDGEELLYVLSGTLNLVFDHDSHMLKPGDAAHFDARMPHRLSSAGAGDAEVLMVAYVPTRGPADLRHTDPPGTPRRRARPSGKAQTHGPSAPVPICASLDDAQG
jgi:transcriptional regulator with XRE-family HTH domain/mannose-6-phosphate isomerase-like protein (cupin superfamily)